MSPHVSLELILRSAGALLLVQDSGRAGLLGQGVSPSGFADAASATRANRLVGNPEGAAMLESLLGGVEFEAVGAEVTIAVSGVEAQIEVEVHGVAHAVSTESPIAVPAGGVLRIGQCTAGLRAMIAVRGGIDAPPVLGSRSSDTLAGLGPVPVTAGDRMRIGSAATAWPVVEYAVVQPPPSTAETLVLEFRWGPRDDRLTSAGRAALLDHRVVSARANRVGVRLDGAAIGTVPEPLPSEPTVAGAIELPTDGIPFVLGRDHPVTVGYPVVGVVDAASLNRLMQARPGTPVRFAPIS